jgi:hypothetical protein
LTRKSVGVFVRFRAPLHSDSQEREHAVT